MTNKIQELVFSFLKMVGMKTKETAPGVWQAAVPEKEQGFFNGFTVINFTFDRETAELHRDVELVCEGSFLLRRIIERLAQIPKVTRLFALQKPEMQPGAHGLTVVSDKSYYRNKVIFNFKVQFDCDQRREKLFSVMTDTADGSIAVENGFQEIDLTKYSEKPKAGVDIEQSGVDVLRLYLEACKKLETSLKDDIAELQEWGEEKCRESMSTFEAYLAEQKQELLKKKENVSFHLYFFQKEEEIDKLIGNLESERERKVTELREKFALRVNISLVNAIVLGIPTIGSLDNKKRKGSAKAFEAPAVRTAANGTGNLSIQ